MGEPALSISIFERAKRILYCRQNRLVLNSWVHPIWSLKGEEKFWYTRDTADGKELVLVDTNKGMIRPAFDHERLAQELIERGIKADPSRLPFDSFHTDSQGIIHLRIGRIEVKCDAGGKYVIGEAADLPTSWNLSPDGTYAVFVEANDLYVRDRRTGREDRLTSDGEELFNYATGIEANETVMNNRIRGTRLPPIVSWSPSCTKVLTQDRPEGRQRNLLSGNEATTIVAFVFVVR